MATRRDARRRGFGGLVLSALLDHVALHGGGLVWCNARVPAQGLYARAGFATRGPVFDIPGIGPHIQMCRTAADSHPLTNGRPRTDSRPPTDGRPLTDGPGMGELPGR